MDTRQLPVLILALLLALPAAATSGVDLRITGHDHALAPDAQQRLTAGVDRLLAVYTRNFGLDMRRPVRLDIHLFPDAAAMQAWLAARDPSLQLPAAVYGLYAPELGVVCAWAHEGGEAALLATLMHEASHVMLESLAPDAPPWLHEGLAQYFEGMDLDAALAGRTRILPVADAREAVEAMVRGRQLVMLRDYFSLSTDHWRHLAHVEQDPVPYTVAWSVAYFLMSRPVGRQIVRELLHEMEKLRQLPTQDVLQRRYPGGYPVLEYEWFRWAQQPKAPQALD